MISPVSLFCRYFIQSIARSLGRSVARSLDRSIARSLARSLGRSTARSIARPLGRSRGLGSPFIRFVFLSVLLCMTFASWTNGRLPYVNVACNSHVSWLLGDPQKSPYHRRKEYSQLAPQASQSGGFRKDILQILKISDECITLSACDLQKLISFCSLSNHFFECIYDLAYFFWLKSHIFECINDLLNF